MQQCLLYSCDTATKALNEQLSNFVLRTGVWVYTQLAVHRVDLVTPGWTNGFDECNTTQQSSLHKGHVDHHSTTALVCISFTCMCSLPW